MALPTSRALLPSHAVAVVPPGVAITVGTDETRECPPTRVALAIRARAEGWRPARSPFAAVSGKDNSRTCRRRDHQHSCEFRRPRRVDSRDADRSPWEIRGCALRSGDPRGSRPDSRVMTSAASAIQAQSCPYANRQNRSEVALHPRATTAAALVESGSPAVATPIHATRALRRSCRAPAAHSCFPPLKRTSPNSGVGRPQGTTSERARPGGRRRPQSRKSRRESAGGSDSPCSS